MGIIKAAILKTVVKLALKYYRPSKPEPTLREKMKDWFK
jgi:hypothetical protein